LNLQLDRHFHREYLICTCGSNTAFSVLSVPDSQQYYVFVTTQHGLPMTVAAFRRCVTAAACRCCFFHFVWYQNLMSLFSKCRDISVYCDGRGKQNQ